MDLPMDAWLAALAALPEVGPARLRWLLGQGSPPAVWANVRAGVIAPTKIAPASVLQRWVAHPLDPVVLWEQCQSLGVRVVCLGDSEYPDRLRGDADPPAVLFHQGALSVLDRPTVAIVGTRRAQPYGRAVAYELGATLARSGVCVVSGLALGIDAAAHRGAASERGPAVAVVGSGHHQPCPRANRSVARDVARSGAVLSEVPPGVDAAPWRFPVRNRVLAALADVVVIVESAAVGGSMHTVREALQRNITVMAVPGPVSSPVSVGPHELIADGALVCTGASDVLLQLGIDAPAPVPTPRRPEPSAAAARVLSRLDSQPVSVERLLDRVDLPLTEALGALGELVAGGWATDEGGWVQRCW
ncbi:MAG: DNA-processing protein DprA [Actinomycetes bacterium]